MGAQTLEAVQRGNPSNAFIGMRIEIARSHHERWDGGGYPQGIGGESIPLSGRIMAVADVYDALRSKRVYKPAFSHDESVRIIGQGGGTQFDPCVVDVFLERADEFEAVFADA